MLNLTDDQAKFLPGVCNDFANTFNADFSSTISREIPDLKRPEELVTFLKQVGELQNFMLPKAVPDSHLPALKRVLISKRRAVAVRLEEMKGKTPHPEILSGLDEQLAPYDDLIQGSWFQATDVLPIPRMLEYLTLERVEDMFRSQMVWTPRKYDEKFHILLAPELFLKDLDYYRRHCDMRGLAVGVAFLDIDDFKAKFNTPYGEFHVDRYVLPRFMEALEAHFFFHGHGYRFGGDEYSVILPNATLESAATLLTAFQDRLTRTAYTNVKERITVSVGLCVADADCFLTNPELLERATKAKNFAKDKGKNCLATFKEQSFEDGGIYLKNFARQVSPNITLQTDR